jgi:hypothetical protein
MTTDSRTSDATVSATPEDATVVEVETVDDAEPATGAEPFVNAEAPGTAESASASGRPTLHVRLLLAAVALQVVAQGGRIAALTLAGSTAALDVLGWIRVAASVAILALSVLAVAELVRRPPAIRPVAWIALGAAIVAESLLIRDALESATATGTSATSSLVDPGPMGAILGVLVFVLTSGAYLALRSPAAAAEPATGQVRARTGSGVTRLLLAAFAVAAPVVVLAGSVVPTPVPRGPVTCVDVTKDVGIAFPGTPGHAVVDGSDMSVLMQQNMGNGVAVGDYDGDGDLDIYLLGQPGHPNRLYRNDHTATHEGFTDVTDAAGLSGLSGTRAAQFVDLDGDGLLDLVTVNDYATGHRTPALADLCQPRGRDLPGRHRRIGIQPHGRHRRWPGRGRL